jgi:hypothetical protein
MKEGVKDGADVLGYTIWDFINLVSCESMEMSRRYGVIYAGQDDAGCGSLRCSKRGSFVWHQKRITTNGVTWTSCWPDVRIAMCDLPLSGESQPLRKACMLKTPADRKPALPSFLYCMETGQVSKRLELMPHRR